MSDPGDDFGEFMDAIGKVKIAPRYTDERAPSAKPEPPVGMMVPPLPRQAWALWNDDPGAEAHGNWVTSIDDAPGGETYLVSFSEAEATNAAIHQNESYGLRCRPMRIK